MQFAGGEPLMIPHHFSVLEKAVDLDYAKQITLRYNTNGTQYPESVLDKWKKFEMVNLDISVDDIGKRFEYQRNGSSWQQVLENCKKFNLQRRSNFKTQITTTVSILNVYYLPEICAWIKSENFDSWWLNLLHFPKTFSITNMTPGAKKLVLEKLTACDFGQYQSQIDVFLSIIQNSPTVDGKDFVNAIKPIDSIRNQNFSLDHSDIAHAMGYVLQ
jgi:MoaA/NifB/PqqE/SkfB family radical SAM enzyme